MSAPVPDFVPGDHTGLPLPAHAEALRAAGPEWLTRAAHAYGSLPPTNRITAITGFAPFAGGNSGHKARLSVAYAQDDPALPRALFVKFSRDFADPFRDRRRYELEAEIRLAALSRHPAFPIAVPAALFGDLHGKSGTGLLISAAIPFGQHGIEPLHHKCMDHELAEPLEYYRTLVAALGTLAGTHKAGRLAPDADRLFPFDRQAAEAELPIGRDAAGVRAAIRRFGEFARTCPTLVPAELAAPAFLGRLEDDALHFLNRQAAVRRFLHADPDYVALLHWNGHIDNAWFHRDATGTLQCGLMDWGMARQMNLGVALWGSLSGAGHALVREQCDALLAHFAERYHAAGGPQLDPARLDRHFALSVMLLMLSMMIDVAGLVTARLPAVAEARGPFDPMLMGDEVARGFLHVALGALTLWQARDFGRALDGIA